MFHSILGLPVLLMYLVGPALFLHKKKEIEFSHALIFSFCTVLSIYFVAALIGLLDPAIYLCVLIGISLFLYILQDFLKNNNLSSINNIKVFISSAGVFSIVVVVYFLKIKNLATYTNWDEYSLWGILVKELDFYHGLRFDPQDVTAVWGKFKQYGQLASIFQYSVTKLIGFKESHIIFANGLILIIFSSVLLIERRILWGICLSIIVLFPALNEVFSLVHLCLDTNIGAAFGAALALYVQGKKYSNQTTKFVLLMPILFVMPNIKEVGYWLSYAAIITIIIDQCFEKTFQNLKIVSLLLLLPVSAKALWVLHIYYRLGIEASSFEQLPIVSIYHLISVIHAGKGELLMMVLRHCLPYFYSKPMQVLYLIIALASAFLFYHNKETLKQFARLLIALIIVFFLYILFRLDLYVDASKFVVYEASIAASHARYFMSYIIGIGFCTLSFLKNEINTNLSLSNRVILADWKFGVIFTGLVLAITFFSLKGMVIHFREVYALDTSFVERQAGLRKLLEQGIDDKQEYKENLKDLLDCFIINYLKAPFSSDDKINKCVDDKSSIKIY